MDEDYARKLRSWLRAEPGATPRRAEEEREWLREVPAPATDGGRVPGEQLRPGAGDGSWAADERQPAPAYDGGWPVGEQLPAPTPDGGAAADHLPPPQPDSDQRWSVRGQLPEVPATQPDADDEWVCPVIVLPVPRLSQENGCRMSAAEVRSRRNHPSGRLREETAAEPISEAEAWSRRNHPSARLPETTAEPCPLSEAEAEAEADAAARSRWNHPSNWHRRRREARAAERDEPGSR
ncbi:hypothetical protein AB0C38_21875 [Amycolatopsis sp. NPDC048633]|uniref:hypothetical protein n=1 Tax=Amycolatopsis sp. NPDC048633 TaxID=3157095 RepID=UPI0033E8E963